MNPLYSDRLVSLTDDALVLKRYYFPYGSRRVELDRVTRVRILRPSLMNGKWRLWGTGTFKIWFPLDLHRPERERVFVMELKGEWRQIGFTVENWEQFRDLLHEHESIHFEEAA